MEKGERARERERGGGSCAFRASVKLLFITLLCDIIIESRMHCAKFIRKEKKNGCTKYELVCGLRE